VKRAGSGSAGQSSESADPCQSVKDPEHCLYVNSVLVSTRTYTLLQTKYTSQCMGPSQLFAKCGSRSRHFQNKKIIKNVNFFQKCVTKKLHWVLHVIPVPAVLRIRIRIRIRNHRIHLFLGLLDPDPLVRGMDPDPASDPDPSINKQN
jgi:hypothetical protein